MASRDRRVALGRRMAELRKALGVSRVAVGKWSGVTSQTIGRFEKGAAYVSKETIALLERLMLVMDRFELTIRNVRKGS